MAKLMKNEPISANDTIALEGVAQGARRATGDATSSAPPDCDCSRRPCGSTRLRKPVRVRMQGWSSWASTHLRHRPGPTAPGVSSARLRLIWTGTTMCLAVRQVLPISRCSVPFMRIFTATLCPACACAPGIHWWRLGPKGSALASRPACGRSIKASIASQTGA